jgi:kynurenine formamidase
VSGGGTRDLDIAWPPSGRQKVYDLAQPLTHGIPHHAVHPPYAFSLTKKHGEVMYPGGISAASELLTLGGHVGTHVDGLGHVSKNGRIHGGQEIDAGHSYTDGLKHGSIEHVAPFIAPGFLIDVPRLLGRALTPDDVVTEGVLEESFGGGREPGSGSAVLVRTGWDEYWRDPRSFLGTDGSNPGVDLSAARKLTERGIVATGSDAIAYEKLPSPDLCVHVHLLVDAGT